MIIVLAFILIIVYVLITKAPAFLKYKQEGVERLRIKSQQLQVIFQDSDFAGWTPHQGGIISQSKEIVPRGTFVLKKDGPPVDPSGGYKEIGRNINLGFIFSGWILRPDTPDRGGKGDRLAIENDAFKGYGFKVDHYRNIVCIERRDGEKGQGTCIGPEKAFSPASPVDKWYRFEFTARRDGEFSLQLYSLSNELLVDVPAVTDSNYKSFDRVCVRGGFPYYVDDLKIEAL